MSTEHAIDRPAGAPSGADPTPAAGAITIPAIAEDGSLYPIEKLEAHQRGLFHLAVSVFVFDGDQLLIQRRAPEKYHCGSQWANTCCTHPHWGEELRSAAERRLFEELGCRVPLARQRVVEYRADVGNGLIEHERVTMFTGEAKGAALRLEPDPAEVSAVRWAGAEELHRDIAARPEAYTPWFRIYLQRFPTLAI